MLAKLFSLYAAAAAAIERYRLSIIIIFYHRQNLSYGILNVIKAFFVLGEKA